MGTSGMDPTHAAHVWASMGSYLTVHQLKASPPDSTRDNRPLTGLSPSLHTVAARADAPGTRI